MPGAFELFTYLIASEGKQIASHAKYETHRNARDIRELEEKLDSLALIAYAMWQLMEERGFSRSELIKKIEALDLLDGRMDGKVTMSEVICPDCGHRVNPKHTNCFWCGAKLPDKKLLPSD